MRKPFHILTRLGMGCLATALILVAVWAVHRKNSSKTQALAAIEAPLSGSISTTPTVNIEVDLPTFSMTIDDFTGGIPRLANLDTAIPKRPSMEVTTYEVKQGDNLFSIAEKYGLRPETVLWGNYETLRDNPQFLKPGQVLNILPTDGVYYEWEAGDNLHSIASFFKVEPEKIVEYPGNRLISDLTSSEPITISQGTWLIIPGGVRELQDWGPPAITRANPAAAAYYGAGYCGQVYEGSIGTGTFIWPTVAGYLSGYDFSSIHPGIDIAGAEGNAVFATDSGVVVFAGWSEYGYGYLIVLDHGNGWQSAYGHLSSLNVGCGQSVSMGYVIGGVGTTGNSTGTHLHFELLNLTYGKVNPWDFMSPP